MKYTAKPLSIMPACTILLSGYNSVGNLVETRCIASLRKAEAKPEKPFRM
jgi:hypothetical protein